MSTTRVSLDILQDRFFDPHYANIFLTIGQIPAKPAEKVLSNRYWGLLIAAGNTIFFMK